MAGDRWRRVRRVSRRATVVVAGLAGGGASRGPGRHPRRVARSVVGGGVPVRAGAAPRAVRRRAQRGDAARRVADGRRDAFDRDRGARPPSRRATPAPRRAGPRLVGSACRAAAGPSAPDAADGTDGETSIVVSVDAGTWAGLTLAPGVIAPADASDAHRLVAAGLRLGLHATIAVTGTTVVGAALSHRPNGSGPEEILAVGVAPAWRRRGIARELLAAHVATGDLAATGMTAEVTVAERDPLPAPRCGPAPRHRPAPARRRRVRPSRRDRSGPRGGSVRDLGRPSRRAPEPHGERSAGGRHRRRPAAGGDEARPLPDLHGPGEVREGDDGRDHQRARPGHRLPRRSRAEAGLLPATRRGAGPDRPTRDRRDPRVLDAAERRHRPADRPRPRRCRVARASDPRRTQARPDASAVRRVHAGRDGRPDGRRTVRRAVRRSPPGPTRSAKPRSVSTTSSCSGTGRAPDASSNRWRVVSSPDSRTCAGGWTATPTIPATTGSS